MNQRTIDSCSVISTNESLTNFRSIDRQEGIHPSTVITKINPGESERTFCTEFEKTTRTLQWALNRLAGW